ncbi:MAG TPA: VWA domain-containing protein [Pyrinomonadaceae bacterium]|nr:VWA domain-containing protein [Pyrinomonadaceae bacterium]
MRNSIYCTLSTLILVVVATAVWGQTVATKSAQQDERVVVGTNLVTVNVIVTDDNGRYVKGLTRDQFALYDEKIKQNIAHFSADASPVSLGIVLEVHENAREKVKAALAALREFTNTLQSRDDFFFVAFSEHGSLKSEFIPSANQVLEHLKVVRPGGPSALYDALYLAADRLQRAHNLKKAILVISDGQDEQSRHSYAELRSRLRTFDAQLYAIGIADPARDPFAGYGRWVFEDVTRETGRRTFLMNAEAAMGRGVLAEMSRVSGGTTYYPDTESEPELTGICTQIALELRAQYTLGFYPSELSNKWRHLKIRVESPKRSPNYSLSYRKGYRLASGK